MDYVHFCCFIIFWKWMKHMHFFFHQQHSFQPWSVFSHSDSIISSSLLTSDSRKDGHNLRSVSNPKSDMFLSLLLLVTIKAWWNLSQSLVSSSLFIEEKSRSRKTGFLKATQLASRSLGLTLPYQAGSMSLPRHEWSHVPLSPLTWIHGQMFLK